MVMWIYGQELIKVSCHPAMFGGHRHSGSGVLILVWHTILQDQLFKGSCNFMGGNPHAMHHKPSMVAKAIAVVKMFLMFKGHNSTCPLLNL